MSFGFIRDHADRWPIPPMCRVSMSRPAAIPLGEIVRRVRAHAPAARCSPTCDASMPSIMAATVAPGCMPRFARKAGRQARAVSRD